MKPIYLGTRVLGNLIYDITDISKMGIQVVTGCKDPEFHLWLQDCVYFFVM